MLLLGYYFLSEQFSLRLNFYNSQIFYLIRLIDRSCFNIYKGFTRLHHWALIFSDGAFSSEGLLHREDSFYIRVFREV